MTDESANIQIARMTYDDVLQVHALDRLCFSAPWDAMAYFRDLRNPSAYYLVAKEGDCVVGFGGMWVVTDEAHVVTLAVQPEYRRHGLGRRLMEGLVAEARRRGATVVTLEMRVRNYAAQHLYKTLGFRLIAYRRQYYPDNNEDAAVMELKL